MPPNPLTNFKIQKYCQNEPRFIGVYSRDNLPACSSADKKDGTYIINLDEYSDIATRWVAFYVGSASPKDMQNNVNYFDLFGVEHVPNEIKKFIGNKT